MWEEYDQGSRGEQFGGTGFDNVKIVTQCDSFSFFSPETPRPTRGRRTGGRACQAPGRESRPELALVLVHTSPMGTAVVQGPGAVLRGDA